jgi:glycosyltransferase 2 family protein
MKGKLWYRLGSYAIILISGIFFISVLANNISSLPSICIDLLTVFYFILSMFLYVIITGISATVWYILLRSAGESARYCDSLMIVFISQFARYIPGNIAHQVGRVALAKTRGFLVSRTVFTMIMEAGWAIASSSFLAAISLLSSTYQFDASLEQYITSQKLAFVAIGAGAIPFLIGYFIRHTPQYFRRFLDGNYKPPNFAVLSLCFFLNILAFCIMGCIIVIISQNLFYLKGVSLLFVTAVFSVSWIAGFLTPGAPAGLGVREAILVAALSPIYGAGNAIGITVALRLATILSDSISFGIGLVMNCLLPISSDIKQV